MAAQKSRVSGIDNRKKSSIGRPDQEAKDHIRKVEGLSDGKVRDWAYGATPIVTLVIAVACDAPRLGDPCCYQSIYASDDGRQLHHFAPSRNRTRWRSYNGGLALAKAGRCVSCLTCPEEKREFLEEELRLTGHHHSTFFHQSWVGKIAFARGLSMPSCSDCSLPRS
jgi:hypothetical protein